MSVDVVQLVLVVHVGGTKGLVLTCLVVWRDGQDALNKLEA